MSAFSLVEVRDIAISLVVLSVVFSYPEVINNPVFLLTALFAVGLAFIGHELSHKFVARKFGYWSEYRMWPQGLFLALLFALITNGGVVFAAPGAVFFASHWISHREKLEEVGRIGAAGPLFNIVLMFVFGFIPHPLFRFASVINGWLAVFNLIPFGPLDGAKVLKWNVRIWLVLFILALSGLALIFFF